MPREMRNTYSAKTAMPNSTIRPAKSGLSRRIRLERPGSANQKLNAPQNAANPDCAVMSLQPSGRIPPTPGISHPAIVPTAISPTTAKKTRLTNASFLSRAGSGSVGDKARKRLGILKGREPQVPRSKTCPAIGAGKHVGLFKRAWTTYNLLPTTGNVLLEWYRVTLRCLNPVFCLFSRLPIPAGKGSPICRRIESPSALIHSPMAVVRVSSRPLRL